MNNVYNHKHNSSDIQKYKTKQNHDNRLCNKTVQRVGSKK